MSEETTACSQMARESASQECSSPPTPKPLDYRSESKRRATVETADDGTLDEQVDSETDIPQAEIQPPGEGETSVAVSTEKAYQEPKLSEKRTTAMSENKVVQDGQQPSHSRSRSFQSMTHSSPFMNDLPGPSRSRQYENWTTFMNPNYNFMRSSNNSGSSSMNHPSFPFCSPLNAPMYDSHALARKWWPNQKGSMDSYIDPASFHEDVALNPGNDWSYGSMQNYSNMHQNQDYGTHFERRQQGCPRSYMHNMHNRPYRTSFRANRFSCSREQGSLQPPQNHKYLPCGTSSGSPFSQDKNNSVHGHRKYASVFGKGKPTRVFQSLTKSNIPFVKKKKRFTKKIIKDLRRPQSAGAILMHSTSSISSRLAKLSIKKKKKDTPEDPNKKALSAAAEKLRKTFLASKKPLQEDGSSKDHRKQSTMHFHSTQENAEDLSIKTYSSNCHGGGVRIIDVTEKENMKTLPTSLSSLHFQNNKASATNPKFKETATCDDVSDETSDEEVGEKKQPNKTVALLQRRRYLSESAGAACSSGSTHPARSRSSSVGAFDSTTPSKRVPTSQEKSAPDRPRINKMLVKQLLNMDKKSLQDLVADPQSRKAQFMVSHLMSEQRSALAQRLDVLRGQQGTHGKTRSLSGDLSQDMLLEGGGRIDAENREEELQILGQMEALELETLSSEVLFQVRQILLSEQHGLANHTLAQAFLSIDDLMSGEISNSAQPQLSGSEAPLHGSISKSSSSADAAAAAEGKEPLQLTCTKLPMLSPPAAKLPTEASFQLVPQSPIGLQKPTLHVQPQPNNDQEQNLSAQQRSHETDRLVEMETMLDNETPIPAPAATEQQPSDAVVTSEQMMTNICMPKVSSASLGTDLRTHQAIERSMNSTKVQEASLSPVTAASDSAVKPELPHDDLNISFEAIKEEIDERLGNKSVSSDMECQIVSPPPKLPPAMITIDDSDPEEVKNFTKNLVAVRLENDENSLPIDVENDNESSLGFTPIEEPTSVFRAPLPHQIISPQARSMPSLHFNIGPPLSRVNASAASSHTLPMSLVPPVNSRDNVNSAVKQTLSLDSYTTSTLTKSSCGVTEQGDRQLSHPLRNAQDTMNVSVACSSSPLPVIMMPEKQTQLNSCGTPTEPKPRMVSKLSPPSTPCQRLPSSIADQRSTSHVFLAGTRDLQHPRPLKPKTSPPTTPPPLIHPSSSLFRSPPNLPHPDKTSPPVSTSPSCSPGDGVSRVLLHAGITARPLMPPPPVQPQPIHNVHLHGGSLHRNLDLGLASLPPQLTGVNERDSSGRRAPPPPPAESLDRLQQQQHGGVVAGAGPLEQTRRLELRGTQPGQLIAPTEAAGPHSTASARPTVKVKEETPSPQLECHLCQHLHHSPHSPQHSPQCCPYTPSPAPSVPPRPPPPMPPAHSPPSQASPAPPTGGGATSGLLAPLYQRTSKQEQPLHGGSFLCENVNRPSSKERPRNPAPPNTPHRIPSPAVLPTPARPVIFPTDPEIPERPAPPHPPAPPQSLGSASPRIKLERHTPSQQYPCCCLRNECSRSLSRASIDGSSNRTGMRSSPSPMTAVPSLAPSNAASGSAVGRLWFFTPSIPEQATGSSHVNILPNHDAGHGHHLHHHRHHHILHHNHPMETPAPSKMKRERLTPSINGLSNGSRLHGVWLPNEPKSDPSEPAVSVAVAVPPSSSTESNVSVPSKSTMTAGFVSVAVQTQTRESTKSSNEMQAEKSPGTERNGADQVDQGTSTDEYAENNSLENNTDVPDHVPIVPAFMRSRFGRRVPTTRREASLSGLRMSRARYRQNNDSLNDVLPSDSRLFRSEANLSARPAQCFVEELCRLSTIEEILLKDLKDVDRQAEELMKQRSSLTTQLMQVQHERNDWMMKLISDGTTARLGRHGRCSVPVMPFLDNLDPVEGTTTERATPDRNHRGESSQEPADSSISLVSSSQENGSSPFDARGNAADQESLTDCSVQKQRCTSTSHSPGLDRSFLKHRDLLQVSEPALYPDETMSDLDHDVSLKPASSLASGDSPSTSSQTPAVKSNHYVFSSIDDDSNTEVRITRRRSKSRSECQDDPNSSKGDEDNNKDNLTRLNVPDTTEEDGGENNLCVVDDSSSECKVEFNVCHNEECPPDSLAQSCLMDQQSSHPDVPTKIFLQSPKSRNSSGSDHSYSLRSRGPPEGEKSKRCRSASQLDSKDEVSMPEEISSPDNTTIELEKELVDDEQTEFEGGEEEDAQSQSLSAASSVESLDCKTACADSYAPQHRHKRKRRSRKHNFGSTSSGNKRKKSHSSPSSDKCDKKTMPLASPSSRKKLSVEESLCPGSGKKKQRMKAFQNRSDAEEPIILPPQLKEAVLDMKVVGNHLFTCSSSSIQCFDLLSGLTAATYACDKANITALAVVGLPNFALETHARKPNSKDETFKPEEGKDTRGEAGVCSPSKSECGGYFEVITGAADGTVCVYNGQRGNVEHTTTVEGAACCLAGAWDQVFVATQTGHTSRWSYKSGGAALEVVEGCPGGVNFLVCHREGCRRVLVMAGRHSPIVIRDAFSGLLLRTLEVVQNTVYRALFVGGQLYTAGSRCIVLYDYASGEKKQKMNTDSDVCSLSASSQYLLACCYDSCIRVYCRQTGELVRVLKAETCHKLLLSSAVFRHSILVGSKGGEIVSVDFSH